MLKFVRFSAGSFGLLLPVLDTTDTSMDLSTFWSDPSLTDTWQQYLTGTESTTLSSVIPKVKGWEDEPDYTNNKKRKLGKFNNFNQVLYQFYINLYSIVFILDVEMNEELRDEVYYKLLPTMFKISELIQRSRDYWEKSYVLRDENEKERYKIMANDELSKAINGLKRQKLTEILFFNL